MIRLTIPSIGPEELDAVREVLESGFLVQGPKVAEFEGAVANYVGVKHAVAVSSGTAALHMSLLALGVGPGDLVITTAYSWPATANVIEVCGAKPIFVDICPNTFNIDPETLKCTLHELMANANTAQRVKAILPVHAFGYMADMPAILDVASRYELPVVEDAACALGSKLHGKSAGAWGVMGCFSFHPRKAITTGEGGMVTTNDDVLVRRIRMLRNHGLDPDASRPDFMIAGLNYRMTDLQGAIGVAQMRKLDRIIATRTHLASAYDRLLAGLPVRRQDNKTRSVLNHQSYVVLLDPDLADIRDSLLERLRSAGVEATIGTWNIPLTTFYRARYGCGHATYAQAEQVFQAALSLPLHERLSRADQLKVVAVFTQELSDASERATVNVRHVG
jgi:perosamine synthetase